MGSRQTSKLEPYAEQLEEWFEIDGMALRKAQKRLLALGCEVSVSCLSRWWNDHKARRLEEQLFALIAGGAKQCRKLEEAVANGNTPELELLIQIHRSLILNLCAKGCEEAPHWLRLATDLMKPVLGWASLQEKRRIRELNEQKYRDQVAAQKAAIERELNAAKASGGINPQTLERVERELKLL
jgi:hypothetical protein